MYFGFCPTKKIFADGAAEQLRNEIAKDARIGIIASASAMGSTEVCRDLGALWQDACLRKTYHRMGEPTFAQAHALAQELVAHEVDQIVAIGGGSIIDLAKAAALLAKMEGDTDEKWACLLTSPLAPPAIPLATVLTVAGTSSESNSGFVVDGPDGYKRAFSKLSCFPRVSVLDGKYVLSLSVAQIRLGLFDAFVHVMEQCMRPDAASLANDSLCASAVALLLDVHQTVLGEGFNLAAANQMMRACSFILDGTTLGRGVTPDSVTHELATYLSRHVDLAHGATLAAVLPQLLKGGRDGGRRERANHILRLAQEMLRVQGRLNKERRDVADWLGELGLDALHAQSRSQVDHDLELGLFLGARRGFLDSKGVSQETARSILSGALETVLA